MLPTQMLKKKYQQKTWAATEQIKIRANDWSTSKHFEWHLLKMQQKQQKSTIWATNLKRATNWATRLPS